MSGVLKGIGKVFRKVGKVVKKIALPALAIGAVVLTGGAALGVLPSIGAIGSSLGLSAGLTGVLSSAATSATIGAVGSALTGGNIVKGASTGFAAGAVLGGIGQMMPKAAGAANMASKAATGASGAAAGSTGAMPDNFAAYDPVAVNNSAMSAPAMQGGGAARVPGPTNAAAGALNWLGQNPMIAGSLVQGIGSGMMAKGQLKAQRKAEEREAENYSDTSQLFRLSSNGSQQTQQQGPEEVDGEPIPYTGGQYVYDRNTGTVRVTRRA